MDKQIILSDLFRKAWKSLSAQIWVLCGLLIGYAIISMLLQAFIPRPVNGSVSIAGMVIALIGLFISLIFELGYTKNLFQALDGEEPQFSAYGQMSRKIFVYFTARLVYGLIVCAGLVLLIVPGIYLAIRLQFYYMAIIEENAGILDSLRRSWEITRGSTPKLFLLLLVQFGILLAGFVLFLIGIFMALPLCGLMSCCAFRRLTVSTTS
ncbi:hypothetical protein [Tannerella sp.]|uniref:hypothetical protein n=1 Tax=Tannerella sp. TaxID=2382127 RepID=UPI0026DB638A|nr:hypothetical protein [Tannerella sp.]MDO4703299.1 hypothetical protein [Tannerella sp.]